MSSKLRSSPYRIVGLALAAVIAISILVVTPTVAGAAGNEYWSIYPTSVTGQTARQYFQPILTPGAAYKDSVTVANFSESTETFNLYPADAFNASGGGAFSLRTEAAPKVGIGAWTQLPESSVTLAANSYEVIPFTINVPQDVTPGDHVGGIVLEPTSGAVTKNGNLKVTILNAVGVRIYGQVQGKLVKSLSITKLSIAAHNDLASMVGAGTTSSVTLTVTNSGNVNSASVATIKVSPLFGGSSVTKVITLPQLLPQNSATFVVPIKSLVPFGKLSATVHLTAPGISTSGSAFTLVIPWLIILIIVLIVAALLWRRHRRKVRAAAAAAAAAPAGAPAATPAAAG